MLDSAPPEPASETSLTPFVMLPTSDVNMAEVEFAREVKLGASFFSQT